MPDGTHPQFVSFDPAKCYGTDGRTPVDRFRDLLVALQRDERERPQERKS